MGTKTTSVALGKALTEYTRRKVESGEFGSASEVIRDALRHARKLDLKREALDQALQEGLDSGPAGPFDFDEFLQEMRSNYKGAA